MTQISLAATAGWKLEEPPLRSHAVSAWLLAIATIVLAMVVVGGATRLTGSGLSITEWKPVSGAIPPLGDADWARAFALYKQSAQYRLINSGISLDQFRTLFWWEWAHRLLARVLAVVFALPAVVFVVTRRLPRRLWGRCVGLFLLGGLQGLAGWWMVKSGLEGRAAVLPERLATHLALALLLLGALVWTALDAWAGPAPTRSSVVQDEGRTWVRDGMLLVAAIFLQCLMGALVAGNHAGLIDGDWPMMAGRVVPEGYWRGGLWTTLAHGPEATQFDHRLLAYAVFAGALLLAWRAARLQSGRPLRLLAGALAACVSLQLVLGVATLWLQVPLALALLHQVNAALLLSLSVAFLWRARRGIPLPQA